MLDQGLSNLSRSELEELVDKIHMASCWRLATGDHSSYLALPSQAVEFGPGLSLAGLMEGE